MPYRNRIRKLRKESGLSGPEVAGKINISTQYLYDIEKEKRGLSAEIAVQLADIFGVPTDYLVGKEEGKNLVSESGIKYSPDPHSESELFAIPIEQLNKFNLFYKGQQLSKEEADDVIELLEAALKRWKR